MTKTMFTKDDAGEYRVVSPEEITQAAKNHLARRVRRGNAMTSSQLVGDYLIAHYSEYEREVFGALFLDARNRIIENRVFFTGTISSCAVYPREVVKAALACNAAAAVLFHNHPSSHPEPSQADLQITRQLKEVLQLVDVRLIDHFIVAGDQSVSFQERGLL